MKRYRIAHTVMALIYLGITVGFVGSYEQGFLKLWAAGLLGVGSIALMLMHIWAAETIRKRWESNQ